MYDRAYKGRELNDESKIAGIKLLWDIGDISIVNRDASSGDWNTHCGCANCNVALQVV